MKKLITKIFLILILAYTVVPNIALAADPYRGENNDPYTADRAVGHQTNAQAERGDDDFYNNRLDNDQ